MGRRASCRWDKMTKNGILLLKLAEQFRMFNRTENKSVRTIGWYYESLRLFQQSKGSGNSKNNGNKSRKAAGSVETSVQPPG